MSNIQTELDRIESAVARIRRELATPAPAEIPHWRAKAYIYPLVDSVVELVTGLARPATNRDVYESLPAAVRPPVYTRAVSIAIGKGLARAGWVRRRESIAGVRPWIYYPPAPSTDPANVADHHDTAVMPETPAVTHT